MGWLCLISVLCITNLEKTLTFCRFKLKQQYSHHLNLYLNKGEDDENKLNFNSRLCTVQSHSMFPNDTYTEPTPPLYWVVISLWTLSHFQRNTMNPRNYSISLLSSNSSYCLWHTALQSTFSFPPPPPCFALFCSLCAVKELFWLLSDMHNMLTPIHRSNTKWCSLLCRRTVSRNMEWIL